MNYSTTRIHGLYSFTLLTGEAYRTTYSPKQLSLMYCFDAIDKEGNLKILLTADVNFKSIEFIQF